MCSGLSPRGFDSKACIREFSGRGVGVIDSQGIGLCLGLSPRGFKSSVRLKTWVKKKGICIGGLLFSSI